MSKFTVADVVQNALAEDPVKLQTALNDVLMDKVQAAVLAKRDEMINNYYTSPEDDEDELEIDDEELDDESEEDDEFDEEDFEEVDLEDEEFSEEDEELGEATLIPSTRLATYRIKHAGLETVDLTHDPKNGYDVVGSGGGTYNRVYDKVKVARSHEEAIRSFLTHIKLHDEDAKRYKDDAAKKNK